MNLGERLYELRKSKNLSQEEVAERLSVTRQTVSKWETNQSTPDFDRVLPLCELYDISTEELFKGEKPSPSASMDSGVFASSPLTAPAVSFDDAAKGEFRAKSAKVVSTAVFIYIAATAVLMVGIAAFNFDPVIMAGIFFLLCAFATAMIIRHYMSKPKFEKTQEEKKRNKVQSAVRGIISGVGLCVYFLLSFLTGAWHITWIIFIIIGLLFQVVKLIFMLRESDEETNENEPKRFEKQKKEEI